MTAKQSIIVDFIKSQPKFNSEKDAYSAFSKATKSDISYAYFSGISKMYYAGKFDVTSVTPVAKQTYVPAVITAPTLYKSKDIVFDDSILVPIKTGTIVDKVISIPEGIMPATVTIVPGESGVGKTTLVLYVCSLIKKLNPKKRILFVSSEMNSIHIFKYAKRIDMTGMEVFLMSESDHPKEEFELVLKQGWDIVILDSLADTMNKIRIQTGDTANAVEVNILKFMDNIRRGENDNKLYTAFLCTQHMTKGGVYTGSTNLKHMTDAMMELKTDPKIPDEPFIEYSKNRDGEKDKRLYYKIRQTGIEFNGDRFTSDLNVQAKVDSHKTALENNNANFDKFFLNSSPSEPKPEVLVNGEVVGERDEVRLEGTGFTENGRQLSVNTQELQTN